MDDVKFPAEFQRPVQDRLKRRFFEADETAEQGHFVFDGGAVEFQHIWGEHDIICQPNNGLTDYWRTQMTKHTNKDITHEDYEAIRKWIENQCEDTAEVIHTLFTSFPFVELASKYEDFNLLVIELIMRYGIECREVSFDESLTYRTSQTIYCDVRETDEQIYEEISNRDIYTVNERLLSRLVENCSTLSNASWNVWKRVRPLGLGRFPSNEATIFQMSSFLKDR